MSFILFQTFVFSQDIILSESFETEIPSEWTQNTNDINQVLVWEWNGDGLGEESIGCAFVNNGDTFNGGDVWLETPFVDLSNYENIEIGFDFSMATAFPTDTYSTFSFGYDDGTGWQFIENWGVLGSVAENIISNDVLFNIVGADFSQLLAEDLTWEPVDLDLSFLSGSSSVRFSFGAESAGPGASGYGDWFFLDNIVVSGDLTANSILNQDSSNSTVTVNAYPNPCTGMLNVSIESINQQANSGNYDLTILDLSGNVVVKMESLTELNRVIDLSILASGMYVLTVSVDDYIYKSTISVMNYSD